MYSKNFPYIVTFYSYKGGVGRSMSLLNVAFELAKRGRHVLILDMDLEAPGISNFLYQNEELEYRPKKDIIELLKSVSDFRRRGGHYDKAAEAIGDISAYITPIQKEKRESLKPQIGEPGRIDTIPALSQESDYWKRLADLALGKWSHETLKKFGVILNHYLKAQRFAVQSPALEEIGETQEVPYDYVLIDSRTGITEAGGLCVGPLADRLVILTGLNDQNITGTKGMMIEFGIELDEKTSGEKWDDGEPDLKDMNRPPMMGPKPTLLVASPVPNGEIQYKRERFSILNRELGPHAAQLSYHPLMALVESIFIRDYPEEYLAIEYRHLTDAILSSAVDNVSQLASLSAEAFHKNKIATAVHSVLRICPADFSLGAHLLRQLVNALVSRAAQSLDTLTTEERSSLLVLSFSLTKIDDQREIAFHFWGMLLSRGATSKPTQEADRLYTLSGQKFQQAIEIRPDSHETLFSWGIALCEQAQLQEGAQADKLYASAYEKFARAVEIKPDSHKALRDWGYALMGQAQLQEGAQADKLYASAYEKFAKAMEIKPDLYEVPINWGAALILQAKSQEGAQAEALYASAYEKYEQALKIKPGDNWALFQQACWHALHGQPEKAIEKLKLIDPQGKGLGEEIRKNNDFKDVLQQPLFQDFLSALESEPHKDDIG